VSGEALARLYSAPPEEFVAERARLVRRLREQGRNEDAAEVAARRKPSLPVFAANRLARERAREIRVLLAAADRLRKAHGRGGPDVVREAQSRLGESLRALVAAAEEVLGRPLSDAHEQRLATTLREAALDETAAGLLRNGVLPEEMEASGFERLAGLAPAPSPRREPPRAEREPARRTRGEVRRAERLHTLEDELAHARKALREAERAFARVERELRRARERVERLESRLEGARARTEV